MSTAVGIVTLIVGLVAWLGQSLSFLAPRIAVRLGVLEPREEVDPTLYVIEARAMGLSDLLLGWILPAAAALMLLRHPAWPYFALTGSGVYLYFSTVIVLSRLYLRREGKKVGRPASERAAYVFGGIWGASALAMIALAVAALAG